MRLRMDTVMDIVEEIITKTKQATSKEYLNWISNFDFGDGNEIWDDDYPSDKEELENSLLLSYLFRFVSNQEPGNHITNEYALETYDNFTTIAYYIIIDYKLFKIETIYGQGAVTGLTPVENYPTKFAYSFDVNGWVRSVVDSTFKEEKI